MCYSDTFLILEIKEPKSNTLKHSFLLFIENRFFSHTIYPDHSFLSLHSSQLPTMTSPLPDPLLLCIRKEQSSKKQEPNITIQNPGRLDKKSSHRSWTRQPNWKKRVPRGGKGVRDTPTPTVRSPTNTPGQHPQHKQRIWCRFMYALCLLLQFLRAHVCPAQLTQW